MTPPFTRNKRQPKAATSQTKATKGNKPKWPHNITPFDPQKAGLKVTPKTEWQTAVMLIRHGRLDEAFSKLVDLARNDDPEAQFFANTLMQAIPGLRTSTTGQELQTLAVLRSPFKHGLRNHPAYSLIAPMGTGFAKRAQSGDGKAAFIMALFHAPSIDGPDKKRHKINTARSLYYFEKVLSDKGFVQNMLPYHKELLDRNLQTIADNIVPLQKPKGPKRLGFKDGSEIKRSKVWKIYKTAAGLG